MKKSKDFSKFVKIEVWMAHMELLFQYKMLEIYI